MAKFRLVHTSFWNDPNVIEEMSPEDKFFFLYLLTNEHTTQVGVYGITKKQIAFEMGYSIETVNVLLHRFQEIYKLVKYNNETREIAIKNWGKYNLVRGGKPILDCVSAELKHIKDISLIEYVAKSIENASIKALYDTYHDTSTSSGQEEEKEKEEEKEEQEQQEKNAAPPLVVVVDNTKSKINPFTFYQENGFGLTMNAITIQKINEWCNDLSDELVVHAMQKAIESNRISWSYAEGILKKWAAKKVKTIQDVENLQAQFEAQQNNRQPYYKPQKVEQVPEWFANREKAGTSVDVPTQIDEDFEAERQAMIAKIRGKA